MSFFINCTRCGKFFETNGFYDMCPICLKLDIEDFDRIRQYLLEHPGAKLFEVSTSLNIPISQIKRYLREERLEILEKDNPFLKCASCHKPISTGQYCDDCAKSSPHSFKTTYVGNSSKASVYNSDYNLYRLRRKTQALSLNK